MEEGERLACLEPPEALLVHHERVTLDGENAGASSRDCAAVVPGPTRLLWPCLANSPMPRWGGSYRRGAGA